MWPKIILAREFIIVFNNISPQEFGKVTKEEYCLSNFYLRNSIRFLFILICIDLKNVETQMLHFYTYKLR